VSLRNASFTKVVLGMSALIGTALLGVALIYLDLSPGIVLVLLVAGIAIPLFVIRPDVGIHLLISMIYVENIIYTTEGTGVKVAGGIILAGWLLSIAVNRRIPLESSPVILLMVALIGWLSVATMFALNSTLATVHVISFVQLGVVMCMFASVVDTPGKVRGVYRAIVLWTTLAAAHGLVLYYLGAQTTTAGLVLNRNVMASYINLAIGCTYILYQMSPGSGERVALLIALPTLLVALALTFSRSGYIALVAVVVLVSYRLAKTKGYVTLGALAAMLVLISVFLPEAFFKRVGTIVPSMQHQEETFGLRVELWKAGINMIRDHPVVGVGPANFTVALGRYGGRLPVIGKRLGAHNAYVGMAAEAGIPGVLLYVLLCVAAIREATLAARGLRLGFPMIGMEAVAVEICVIVLLIAGLTGNVERTKYLYIFFGLAMSLSRMARQQLSAHVANHGAEMTEAEPVELGVEVVR